MMDEDEQECNSYIQVSNLDESDQAAALQA